jgi:GSCFA family
MDFMINIDLKKLEPQINYQDKILLIGSCFTEHIGNSLGELKFSTLQNPNGILFDAHSVCNSLNSYIENKKYTGADFFHLYDVWHSWDHHSRCSNTDIHQAVDNINQSQQAAHESLKSAQWLIVTLGSSFSYRLTKLSTGGQIGEGVANCHRAPAQWFKKYLMTADEIISEFENCFEALFKFNPELKIIFTVSPVRHIRDGVIQNNRSKSRLIEAVHNLEEHYANAYYFPAYELVIDVLRDYRFYDADLVHPNYMATEFVLAKFEQACIDEESNKIMNEVKQIVIARKHKAFQPDTSAHRQFLQTHFEKAKTLQSQYSFLDLQEEINYFNS